MSICSGVQCESHGWRGGTRYEVEMGMRWIRLSSCWLGHNDVARAFVRSDQSALWREAWILYCSREWKMVAVLLFVLTECEALEDGIATARSNISTSATKIN